MKKTNYLIVVGLIIILLTVGCTTTMSESQVDKIKVGVILPLSGNLSLKAQSHKLALETALVKLIIILPKVEINII